MASGSGPLTGAGLAAAVALITARNDPDVTRGTVLEGCDLAEVLTAMEEIAFVVLSTLPSDERERMLQFFGLTAIAAAADVGESQP